MWLVDFARRRACAKICLVAAVWALSACSVYGDELIDKNAATTSSGQGGAGGGQGGAGGGTGPGFDAGDEDPPTAGTGGYDTADATPADGTSIEGDMGFTQDDAGPEVGLLDAPADKVDLLP